MVERHKDDLVTGALVTIPRTAKGDKSACNDALLVALREQLEVSTVSIPSREGRVVVELQSQRCRMRPEEHVGCFGRTCEILLVMVAVLKGKWKK